jgi:DNA polymerase III alpha subunit
MERGASGYVPLRVHSHYSFLDSTLSPTTIVELAKRHGLSSVALTDTGNLHGAVEFVEAAKKEGVKPILGVEVRVGDQLLAYGHGCCPQSWRSHHRAALAYWLRLPS